MSIEAPVLGGDHGGLKRGGDLCHRGPGEPPPRLIGPQVVEERAVSIQQLRIRRAVGRAHLGEGGDRGEGRAERQPEEGNRAEEDDCDGRFKFEKTD